MLLCTAPDDKKPMKAFLGKPRPLYRGNQNA